MAMSICGHCETFPPLSLMSFQASSVRLRQWMYSSPGRDDSVRSVDHGYVARRADLGAYLANLAVLDQYVALGKVPDLGIEREKDSPLDEDLPRTLQAHKCRIASILGARSTRERLSYGKTLRDHRSA
jgi:hypothetical protein